LPAIGMFEYRLSFLNNNLSIYLWIKNFSRYCHGY
jgi:hypothetical protein